MTQIIGFNTAVGSATSIQTGSSTSIGWNVGVQASQNATANGIYFYLVDKAGAATHIQLSLYSNSTQVGAGGGGTLIANTASTLISGLTNGQFNYIPFIAPVAVTTTPYYNMAVQGDGSIRASYYSASPTVTGAHLDTGQTYGTVPGTLPVGSNDFSGALAMYVDGTAAASNAPPTLIIPSTNLSFLGRR